MRLTRVEIEGYRSIGAKVDIHVDGDVTVLLGANDHGKTNVLNAIEHLNANKAFNADTDLNWDRAKRPDEFPCIVFHLRLHEDEQKTLADLLSASSSSDSDPDSHESVSASIPVSVPEIPEILTIEVKGVGASREYRAAGIPAPALQKFVDEHIPRVELIRPQEHIPDSVSASELDNESHEFMRGIFYYAGIDPDEAGELFAQNDTTMRQLKKASVVLNETLKAGWIQGRDLVYELGHDSASQQVLLRIQDPAVDTRLVRASQRSSGFTHFFALKTILYARQQDYFANQYIFLFDEPGIYLHPSGQRDLLAVLDAIGKYNQVIYSTHSLFMINRTFAARHRLIVKDRAGTRIDGKPYVGRWGPAIEELGFSMAGTVLFAQYVLLAEGDADPVLLHAVFQKLVEWRKIDVDLNAFSVISTGSSKNTDALIRILKEGANAPSLLVMVDGDDGGKRRLKGLQSLLKGHNVESLRLVDKTTIEDYMPAAGETYVDAVGRYVANVTETLGMKGAKSRDEILGELRRAAEDRGLSGKDVSTGVAKWALEKAMELAGLDTEPSKLGVAREYVQCLEGAGADTFTDAQLRRSVKLLGVVQGTLDIPKLGEPAMKVTTD